MRYALRGAFHAAFLVNPLVFATLAGIVVFDFYAATVLALRLPRLRPAQTPARIAMPWRAGCAGLLLVNWLWLLHTSVCGEWVGEGAGGNGERAGGVMPDRMSGPRPDTDPKLSA